MSEALTQIFFIAHDSRNQQVGLYKLSVDPWKEMNDDYTLTQILMSLNTGGHCFNQIMKAAVIRAVTRGEIEKFAIVI